MDKRNIHIGLSFFNHTTSYLWGRVNYFAHVVAKDKEIELVVKTARSSLPLQIKHVQQLAARKVNAIIIAAKSSDDPELVALIQQIMAMGIPVIAMDSEIGNGNCTCTVSADNVNCQQTAATYILEKLDGTGKIIHIKGNADLHSTKMRAEGLHIALSRFPNVKLQLETYGNYEYAPAYKIITDYLKTAPDFDAVIAANDLMAEGVVDALEQSGIKKPILVSGFDAHHKTLNSIRQNKIAVTVRYDAQQLAQLSLEMALRAIKGEAIPQHKLMDVHLVTLENVGSEIAEHLDILPDFVSLLSLTNEQLQQEIEERKQAQTALRSHAEALEESQLKLKAYADELERSNQELQNFAFVASHDLREPLRKIQIFGSRLQERYSDILDKRGLDYLARMQSSSARMETFIGDLLAYSRLSRNTQVFEIIDLHQTLQNVTEDLKFQIQENDANIIFNGLPAIEANPTQMQQLFQNLLSNAIKFRQENKALLIEIHSQMIETNSLQIEVKDNGIGFEPEYAERIFGMFQRLHGRSAYEGTGIGLAICRKIVEQHHGTITAVSQPKQGATFILTLPIIQPQ